MDFKKILQLLLAIIGVGFIVFGDTYFDAIGVFLIIWSNNIDYARKEQLRELLLSIKETK